jgi:multicomponent Na+:H+ antiporter subunit D
MSSNLPILLFLVPFVTGVALPILTAKRRSWCQPITTAAIALMVVLAIMNLQVVLTTGSIEYALGGWAAPVGIAWLDDPLAAVVVLTLSCVALLSLIYGHAVVTPRHARSAPYYTLILVLIAGLVGIVFAADLFNVFVFLEVAALTSYALVGAGGGKALVYAFRYLLLGSFGATLYLLGVSYLYVATGTLNMADLATRLPDLMTSTAVVGGLMFIFLGLSIKMALIPLHTWLPDAYARAPESVVPLLASTITKVAIIAWVRIEYSLIAPGVEVSRVPVLIVLEELGILAALVGGALALIQTDLKRMFAYGGIGHIGLILVGASLGNSTGFAGAMFYLINDAVMQAALFMFAGAVLHYHGARTLEDLRGVGRRSPILTFGLVVVAVSMVGLPPTGGFFGKWNIILGALEAQHYLAAFAVVASTLLTLAYFVKIFGAWFHQPAGPESEPPQVSGFIGVSVGVISIAIIALGLLSDPVFELLLDSMNNGGN